MTIQTNYIIERITEDEGQLQIFAGWGSEPIWSDADDYELGVSVIMFATETIANRRLIDVKCGDGPTDHIYRITPVSVEFKRDTHGDANVPS